MTRLVRLLLLAAVCTVGLALTAAAATALAGPKSTAQVTRLLAVVGPGPTIVLTHENGSRVTQLDPGRYVIDVDDRSDEHNFRLQGPGVSGVRTDVGFVGTRTFTVDLVQGRYTYDCEPHSSSMRGTFTVGNPPAPQPAPPPQPARRLVATVGPGATITLRTPAGRAVRTTPAGRYSITVRDRSAHHNFRLIGRGVNRATGVPYRGTVTWTVQLRKGATYTFRCDPHAARMRGTFRAS